MSTHGGLLSVTGTIVDGISVGDISVSSCDVGLDGTVIASVLTPISSDVEDLDDSLGSVTCNDSSG